MTNDISLIPITDIKGISEVREKLFGSVGIKTVGDLLSYYPRAYQDRSDVKDVFEAADGETVSLILEVMTPLMSKRVKSMSKRIQTVQHIMAADKSGNVKIVFFNREFLDKTFAPGKKFRFYGTISKNGKVPEMVSPDFEPWYPNLKLPPFIPLYSLTAGLSQKLVSTCVGYSLNIYKSQIKETLPKELLMRNGLCSYAKALRGIHYPNNSNELEEAKRRLAFEELYTFFLKTMRLGNKDYTGKSYRVSYPDMKAFTAELPYVLTTAQKYAIHDILKDMSGTDKPELFRKNADEFIAPSRRLVQGDVGCGKTMVACAAIYAAAKSGYQAALMAPTGILAKQHYEELSRFLGKFGIKCVLITGGMRVTEKRAAIVAAASGDADVVIGTHALIEDEISFNKLALVVTDEQHRFGVMQRKALEGKSSFSEAKPHVVVMSATPIPRTLAMIMYCDLDISIIDKLPSGRKPVETYAVSENKRKRMYNFVYNLVESGKQAYVVCPLAESNNEEELSAKQELKAAKQYCESLKKTVLGKFRIEYIHGKMKQSEKDEIMQRFADGAIDILVSTTVIEVGVNVPNSCVMLIENCERFGLSQLHQLRGRVGRGSDKAYCILMSPLIDKARPDSDFRKRIDTICKSNSGFVIAEKDLELRGPGEFFGIRQSGEFRFQIANIAADMDIVNAAKKEATDAYESENNANISVEKTASLDL